VSEVTERWEARGESLEDEYRQLKERCQAADTDAEREPTQSAGERRTENEADTVDKLQAQISHLREEIDTQYAKEALLCQYCTFIVDLFPRYRYSVNSK